jgi:hypothetical protein
MQLFYRLRDLNEDLINKICNSLKGAYDPALTNYFIYHDLNFRSYLCSIITSPDVYIFYSVDRISKELTGFTFFEVENRSIYLRNIIIDHNFIFDSLGVQIFFKSISFIKNERSDVEILQLDAFEKNRGVLNWYLSIGMKISKFLYWYDITNLLNNSNVFISNYNTDAIELKADKHGFTQLLYNEHEIGSLIQGKYLIIKTSLTQDMLNQIRFYFLIKPPLSVCLISNEKHDLLLIERSVHFVISLKKLKIREY